MRSLPSCRPWATLLATERVNVDAPPWALSDDAFVTVAVPDFEPVAVSTAVTVALATASWRATAAGWRRHRALHDGPLRVLTAIAGQGPAGHPDPRVRRQAAISANVLRGATPDDPDGTLTELSLALIEAGNDSATQGLRVEYHFANLPDTLPSEVLHAFRHATGEALANVARHAGSSRARLTALTDRQPTPTVTVAVVDQGKGFDPDTTPLGYGIRHSITARMHEVGGTASVDSHPGQGTRIDLRWPA